MILCLFYAVFAKKMDLHMLVFWAGICIKTSWSQETRG